jgi:hypothetical protein
MTARWPLGAAVFVLLAGIPARGQTPEELRRLIEQRRAEEAYQLGRKGPERMGDPAFDLPFGIAAIHAGRAAEGVLALERVLLAQPGHEGARVELARGYYLLGEDARAREEFEAALAAGPPPEVARVIREYLAAIRAREAKYRPTAMAWIEAGGGYDSNPRAGVDDPVLTLPVLGEVTVADTGTAKSDQSRLWGGGFRLTGPLSAHAVAFAAADATVVRYPDVPEFDQEFYSGAVGAQGRHGAQGWRAGASLGYQTLARAPYRRTHGAFGEWNAALGERDRLTAGVQVGQFDYEGSNNVRDAHFRALTLGWKRLVAEAWRSELEVAGNAGRERNIHAERQDLSRDVYWLRIGLSASPFAGWTLGAGALALRSEFLEPDAILLTTREDRYAVGDLSVAWSAWRSLAVRAEFTAAKNESNIALYEYRRKTALVRVRYEFP